MCTLLSIIVFIGCWISFSPSFTSALAAQGALEAVAGTMTEELLEGSFVTLLTNLISDKLARARVTSHVLEGNYIERKRLEGVLKGVFNEESPESYYIVYGAKGAGKSTLVDYVAKDHQAVVTLAVRPVDDLASITAKFMFAVTNDRQAVDVDILRETLREFKARKGIIPSIIFEVERGAADPKLKNVLQDVRSMAKDLADVCHCIIVVSEANAVFEFGSDMREVFIYVDELSYEESDAFLRKRGSIFTEEEMKKIYDNVGGNLLVLKKIQIMLKNSNSLDASIDKMVNLALSDLEAFQIKPILKAIKDNPNGVRPGQFEGQTYKGIDMSEAKFVGDAMKLRNAIIYRIDLEPMVFQMQSTRHKTALGKYEPVIDENLLSVSKPVTDYHTPKSEQPKAGSKSEEL